MSARAARDDAVVSTEEPVMNYEYLFCPTCGVRRFGHRYRCTVCDSLLRRTDAHRQPAVAHLRPLVRVEQPAPAPARVPQPIAA